MNDMFKQMEELFLKVDKLSDDLKEQKKKQERMIKELEKAGYKVETAS